MSASSNYQQITFKRFKFFKGGFSNLNRYRSQPETTQENIFWQGEVTVQRLVKHETRCAETDDSGITVELETLHGQETYHLPSHQLDALRTYLKILTCMNANSAVVTPAGSKKRSCS